jgi:hypothetical protein
LDNVTKKRGKPHGAHGVEIHWESTTNLKGPYGEIYSGVIP